MTVRTSEGQELVPVEKLQVGQEVATMDDDGRHVWTKVVLSSREIATSPFRRVLTRGSPLNLTITEEHMSPRLARASESSFARFDAVMAKDLTVGDWVPMLKQSGVVEVDIVSVEHMRLQYKNVLATGRATVLANGFLTTSVCEGAPIGQNMSHLVKEWQHKDQAFIL